MAVRIAVRRDTTAHWTTANPVLVAGEPALDTTTGSVRYGNGVDQWADLPEHSGDSTILASHALRDWFAPATGVAASSLFSTAPTVSGSLMTIASQTGTLWNAVGKFRYLTGAPTLQEIAPGVGGGITLTTGALNNQPTHLNVSYSGTGIAFMVYAYGVTDVQVYVNSAPVWARPQLFTPGVQFVNVPFAAAGDYDVTIVLGNAVFFQALHSTTDTLLPGRPRFVLGLDGDSYADVGQAPYFAGLGGHLFARTGFAIRHFGQGSTGWAAQLDNPNTLGKSEYGSLDRQTAWAAQDLDAMLVLGSINSGLQSPATVAAALDTYYDRLQAVHPGIPLIVAGVEPYNLGTSPAQEANNDALRDKADELGIPFIDWFGEAWMTGTGSTAAPVGDGSQDQLVGADGVHLNEVGNRLFADRFAADLALVRATAS